MPISGEPWDADAFLGKALAEHRCQIDNVRLWRRLRRLLALALGINYRNQRVFVSVLEFRGIEFRHLLVKQILSYLVPFRSSKTLRSEIISLWVRNSVSSIPFPKGWMTTLRPRW